MWHLRRTRAPVRFPQRIRVVLVSLAVLSVLAALESPVDPLVLAGLVPLVLGMLVSLESQLVRVVLVPLVLVVLVSLESQLVRVVLAPLVLVVQVNRVDHAVPAVQASPVAQVNPVAQRVQAALVSQVDQPVRQAPAALVSQAALASNHAARSCAAHNVCNDNKPVAVLHHNRGNSMKCVTGGVRFAAAHGLKP